jgi:Methyltransferase domain
VNASDLIDRLGLDVTDRDRREQIVEIPNMNRRDLASLFAELGYTVGAEVGVDKGEYSELLCQTIPGLHLFCVDPYSTYKDYVDFTDQAALDANYATARERLAPYHVTFLRLFNGYLSFPNNCLDFVYIDGNHSFEAVTQDLNTWPAKVRPGGIVSGHDWRRSTNPDVHAEVVPALRQFVREQGILLFLVGQKEPQPGHKRDRYRSWFWVVES